MNEISLFGHEFLLGIGRHDRLRIERPRPNSCFNWQSNNPRAWRGVESQVGFSVSRSTSAARRPDHTSSQYRGIERWLLRSTFGERATLAEGAPRVTKIVNF
jgi:hypothetical protein